MLPGDVREGLDVMLLGVFEMIRNQRNDSPPGRGLYESVGPDENITVTSDEPPRRGRCERTVTRVKRSR